MSFVVFQSRRCSVPVHCKFCHPSRRSRYSSPKSKNLPILYPNMHLRWEWLEFRNSPHIYYIICRVYWLHWFHVLHTVLCQVNANHPRTSLRHFWTTAGPRPSQTTRPHFQASKEKTQGDEELGSILVPISITRWNCNLSQKRFDLDLKTLDRNTSLLCRLQPFNMANKPRSGVLTDLVHCNIFPWKIMMILCTTNAIWEDNFFQTGRLKAAFSSAHNFRKTLYGLTVIDVSVRLWTL